MGRSAATVERQLRLVAFFAANPSEELTIYDVADKLMLTREAARHVVKDLVDAGFLTAIPGASGGLHNVYARPMAVRAGPELSKLNVTPCSGCRFLVNSHCFAVQQFKDFSCRET